MADSSFDVVSKVDRQEVDNALNQAAKELSTRFDFRGTDTSIEWQGEETVVITSSTEERVKAAVDVFKEKLVRRDISMKAFDAGDPQASGKTYKVSGQIKQGISSEQAKKITKIIRDEGPQGRQGADPGRRDPGVVEEARRPAGRHRAAQRRRPRRRAAVRQLPLSGHSSRSHSFKTGSGAACDDRRMISIEPCDKPPQNLLVTPPLHLGPGSQVRTVRGFAWRLKRSPPTARPRRTTEPTAA